MESHNTHNMHNPMAEERPGAQGDWRHDEVHYEERDVRLRPLLAAAAGLASLVLIIALAMAGMYHWLVERSGREPVVLPPSVQLPDERQLEQLRLQEEELLSEYAWVDRRQNVVRIPIERAMELTADRLKEGEQDE